MAKGRGRAGLIAACFAEAARRGIDAEALREEVAPGIIRTRLSRANEVQLARLLKHLKGADWRAAPRKREPPSMEGLRREIEDLARQRFGNERWDEKVNRLAERMFERVGVDHWRWLDMWHTKELKKALVRLERRGDYGGANNE